MEAFVESIPKHQTNATGEYLAYLAYLARYVLGTLGNANTSREFETLGTADAWLSLFGRTKQTLQVAQLTSVFCLMGTASASGGDRQNQSKNPTRRRLLPTELSIAPE